MELHGTLVYNLQLALDSARRLRDHPVHRDTLAFWSDLVGEARARGSAEAVPDDLDVQSLIGKLEAAIVETKADSNS